MFNKKNLTLLTVFLALISIAAAGTVKVQVENSDSNPVSRADVTLYDGKYNQVGDALTGQEGSVTFNVESSPSKPITYRAAATKKCYSEDAGEKTIDYVGDSETINLQISKYDPHGRLTVKAVNDGEVIEGADVTVEKVSTSETWSKETGSYGEAQFNELPYGEYNVQVRADSASGTETKTKTFNVNRCGPEIQDWTRGEKTFNFDFEEQKRPEKFSLRNPDDREEGVSLQPTLEWESSSDPDGGDVTYTVTLENLNGDDSYEYETDRNYVDLSHYSDELKENTGYEWSVTATDDEGSTTETVSRTFTTKKLPAEITETGPNGELENPVQLSVELDGKGSFYDCYWDDNTYVSKNDEKMNYAGENRYTLERTFSEGETHQVWFKCFSGFDKTQTKTTSFTVAREDTGDNEDPQAELTVNPDTVKTGESITFDASGSTDNNEIDRYEFDFDNDGETDVNPSYVNNGKVTTSFDHPYNGKAKVTVYDEAGNSDSATVHYTVEARDTDSEEDPVADLEVDPAFSSTGEEVEFNASGSTDEDGEIEEYRFDYDGDGDYEVTQSSSVYTRSFSSPTSATAEVKVIDDDGNSGTAYDRYQVGDDSECRIETEALKLSKDNVKEGETVEARIKVNNHGDSSQKVKVEFELDGERKTRSKRIGDNSATHFFADFTPEESGYATATVRTIDGECGDTKVETDREWLDVESRDTDGDGELTVSVEDSNGRSTDARVEIRNGEDYVRYTGGDGRTTFKLPDDSYDVIVSKDNHKTETKEISISGGSNRLDFQLEKREEGSEFIALVQDSEGNRLENAEVRVENSETQVDYTNQHGRSDFQMDSGMYEVTASKEGYHERTIEVYLSEGEKQTETLTLYSKDEDEDEEERGLVIEEMDYPSSVCRGGSMKVDVQVENRGGFHEFVTVTGKGLGSINAGKSFRMQEGDTKTRSIRFTNVQGSGNEDFTITVTNHDSDSETRSVDVRECEPSQDTGTASGITLELSDSSVRVNNPVKASGIVDGVEGRTKVRITANGKQVAETTTEPDGYYSTYFRPTEVGKLQVEAAAGNSKETRTLSVKATSNVAYAKSPQKVFQGESFQICGEVKSQVTPEVYLQKNGQIVASKNQGGKVCFNRTASEVGTHKYEIIAWAYGQKSVASTTTEILKMDSEVENFPDKIASVESGSGEVKVRLYNTNQEQTRYTLKLEGLPDTWSSQTEKEVSLSKGESEEVVFYIAPEEEGEYTADLKVESGGETIHSQEVNIWAGGTTQGQKGFLERLLARLPF